MSNEELKVCGPTLEATFMRASSYGPSTHSIEVKVNEFKFCRTKFLDDRRVILEPYQRLYCLLVGCNAETSSGDEVSHYALVLMEDLDSRYKRVGLLNADCKYWFSAAPIRTFDLA